MMEQFGLGGQEGESVHSVLATEQIARGTFQFRLRIALERVF
jgi:hypothetical protein